MRTRGGLCSVRDSLIIISPGFSCGPAGGGVSKGHLLSYLTPECRLVAFESETKPSQTSVTLGICQSVLTLTENRDFHLAQWGPVSKDSRGL